MSSISSQMMSSICSSRNANGHNWHTTMRHGDRIYTPKPMSTLIAAEASYMFTFAFSIVETVAKAALYVVARPFLDPSSIFMQQKRIELSSAAFTIGWSLTDIFINPFCLDIAASEAQARNILSKGHLLAVPDYNIV